MKSSDLWKAGVYSTIAEQSSVLGEWLTGSASRIIVIGTSGADIFRKFGLIWKEPLNWEIPALASNGAVMTHGYALPEGFYEALLSVIREGYPGKEIKPLTNAELEAIDRDMQELAHLHRDEPVDMRAETDAYLQEIIRVTLENSGLPFEE